MNPIHIIILAAGQGTRMRSSKAKVLHTIAQRPMLDHVIGTAETLSPEAIHVVYGHDGDSVRQALAHRKVN